MILRVDLYIFQVNKNWKLFTKNASERLKLFVKAFSAEDNNSALGFILQAKSLVMAANKLLGIIKSKQVSHSDIHIHIYIC